MQIVEADGPSVGLHLNRYKSLLHAPSTADCSQPFLPSEIPVSHEGFCLLGCPIGPPSFCEAVLANRVASIKESLLELHYMEDSQLETALLRSCLSLPKISYVLRSVPPSHIPQALAAFDMCIREGLEAILGGPCSEWSWTKATLPNNQGVTDCIVPSSTLLPLMWRPVFNTEI